MIFDSLMKNWKIGKSENREIGKLGNGGVGTSECLDIGRARHRDIGKSGDGRSGNLEMGKFGIGKCGDLGF